MSADKSEKSKTMNLLIVESPTKERTISKFLGKNFIVKSSFGHLRDLPKKKFGINLEKGFEPQYEVLPRGKTVIPDLKKSSSRCAKIYLATDYDREGESIAWHLSEILGLPAEKSFRITFHEITPTAIQEAISSPRKIDTRLVDSQVARRVLDRIVGYRLSPLLWEKVRRGLSAGRVQSAAVRIICEREGEIEKFKSQEYWTVQVELENTRDSNRFGFLAQIVEWKGKKVGKLDIPSQTSSQEMGDILKGSSYTVRSVSPKEKKRSPPPPFMTSTLAQDASRKLGFSSKKTMLVAQTLYEGVQINQEQVGLITYMRTDSLNISQTALNEVRSFIQEKYGKGEIPEKPRLYKTKAKTAQEAHEAIHPTSVHREPQSLKDFLTLDQLKLYGLIWKRFVACQMMDAVYDTVSVDVASHAESGAGDGVLRANGSTLKRAGFLKVYGEEEIEESQDKGDKGQEGSSVRLPLLYESEPLKFLNLKSEQHFTEPPPRYNEASLIKILEQNGIGRPSTYAPIIGTILSRGYVRLQERRFHPTDLGKVVNQQLIQHFPEVVDISFTAKIEEKLDQIAEGEIPWNEVVKEFYEPFEKDLSAAATHMQKISVEPKDSGEICPLCQGKLLIRESRFGKYLSCENFPKCKHKVSLDADGKKILPQVVDEKCPKCGKPMAVKMSRRGKFLACTGYPECKSIIGLDREGNKVIRPEPQMTDKKCEKCGKPMLLRVGKRGPFLACSGFPRCRNIKPVKKSETPQPPETPDAGNQP